MQNCINLHSTQHQLTSSEGLMPAFQISTVNFCLLTLASVSSLFTSVTGYDAIAGLVPLPFWGIITLRGETFSPESIIYFLYGLWRI